MCIFIRVLENKTICLSNYFDKYPKFPIQYPTARAPWGPGVQYLRMFPKYVEKYMFFVFVSLGILGNMHIHVFKITHIQAFPGFPKGREMASLVPL